jgi:thioredoxin 1
LLARGVHKGKWNMKETKNMNSENRPLTFEVTEASFGTEVLQSKQPVLVEFWAPWSRPCQVLESVLNELAAEWSGEVKVVKVNADDSPDLSLLYSVQAIPTLLYFVEGEPRSRVVGTASKNAILAKLKPCGPPI